LYLASAAGYILRSSLDHILVEHAAQIDADSFEEEAGDQFVLFHYSTLFNSDDHEDDSDVLEDDAA
jgi:hypothetical protein